MIPTLLFSSKVLLVSFPWRNRANPATHFSVCFDSSSPIAQTIDVSKEFDPFTVSYFINSCGLSLESAKLVSKHVQIKNPPSPPDSVLDCLKNYGFSDADISKVIRRYPKVLLLKAERNLKPKMDFFLSIGVKGDDLIKIICRNPTLLGGSLHQKIIPCHEFFKRVLVDDELVVKSFVHSSWFRMEKLEKDVVPNLKLLKSVGVPESNIQSVLIYNPGFFDLDNVRFSKRVEWAVSKGFEPSKNFFLEALRFPTKGSSWERKKQVFLSRGWSESECWSAFKKNPTIMKTSVEKLEAVMEFLVSKMGYDPSDVAAAPCTFFYSLKKNIIPRCSVVRVLMLMGLIEKKVPLLTYPKKRFVDKFVLMYLEQVPQLLDIFEGKVDLSELGYGFEEQLDTKLKKLAS